MFGRKKVIREERKDITSIVESALTQAIISSKREAAKTAAQVMVDIGLDVWRYVKDKLGNEEEAKYIFSTVWKDVADTVKTVLFTEVVKSVSEEEE